jgi:hypothetical protein
VIAVHAPEAEARSRALGIIEACNAYYVNFYGKWTIEVLKP